MVPAQLHFPAAEVPVVALHVVPRQRRSSDDEGSIRPCPFSTGSLADRFAERDGETILAHRPARDETARPTPEVSLVSLCGPADAQRRG